MQMCILAGCDFVPSLPGMGVKTAHSLVRRYRNFPGAIKAAKLNGSQVPPEYAVQVQHAYWTFRHQRVWCPKDKRLVHLHALPDGGLSASRMMVPQAVPADATLPFLGPLKANDLCANIALGHVDPLTNKQFVVRRMGGIVQVTLHGQACPELIRSAAGWSAGPRARPSAVQPGLRAGSCPVSRPQGAPSPSKAQLIWPDLSGPHMSKVIARQLAWALLCVWCLVLVRRL
jgi:hypothetical protein